MTSHGPTSLLQQKAVAIAAQRAKEAYKSLPTTDPLFQQCLDPNVSLIEMVNQTVKHEGLFSKRRSTRLLQDFQKYTAWIHNSAASIDILVATQAGIGCPIWAPIKFVLKSANDAVRAADEVHIFIRTISESLPRFNKYEKLRQDDDLNAALLDVFTDIAEFSLMAFRFFGRNQFTRFYKQVGRSFKDEFNTILNNVTRHASIADQTAIATELLRNNTFRSKVARLDQQNTILQIQMWLKPANTRLFQTHQLKNRHPGTCEWIWNDRSFQMWLESNDKPSGDRLLYVYGFHGCGKTVLASTIVEKFETQKSEKIMYFPFSGLDICRHDFDALARSLLWQVVRFADSDNSLEIAKTLMLQGPPVTSDIWRALQSITSKFAEPMTCVLDGVDECSDTDSMWAPLSDLLDSKSDFKVIVLGRTYINRGAIPSSLSIEITPDVTKRDLQDFISRGLDNHAVLELPDIRGLVHGALQSRSQGMFLFAKLMIEHLRNSDSRNQALERVNDLPNGLEEASSLMLLDCVRKLDKYQLRLVRNVLLFLVMGFRPLTSAELQHLLAVERTQFTPGSSKSYQGHLITDAETKIERLCHGLVRVHNGTFHLSHFSLKEFLSRPEANWEACCDNEVAFFRVDIEEAHEVLGVICYDYLSATDLDSPLSDASTVADLDLKHPLLSYASQYGMSHCYHSKGSQYLLDRLLEFVECRQFTVWLEYMSVTALSDESGVTVECIENDVRALLTWLKVKDSVLVTLFQSKIEAAINSETSRRTEKYGLMDERSHALTGLLVMFQVLMGQSGITKDTATPTVTYQGSSEMKGKSKDIELVQPHQGRLTLQTEAIFNETRGLLKPDITPLHSAQVKTIVALGSMLGKVQKLADPLQMFSQMVLKQASKLPVYVLIVLGHYYERLNKHDEALELLRIALKKLESQESPAKWLIQHNIGVIFMHKDRMSEAETFLYASLSGQDNGGRKEDWRTYVTCSCLADVYRSQGKNKEAEDLLRRCSEGRMRGYGADETTLGYYWDLASACQSLDKNNEAKQHALRVYRGLEKILGCHHPDVQEAFELVSSLAFELRNYDEDEHLLRERLDRIQEGGKGDPNMVARNMQWLVITLWNKWKPNTLGERRDLNTAMDFMLQTITYHEEKFVPKSEDLGYTILCWSEELHEEEKYEELGQLVQAALPLFRRSFGETAGTLLAYAWKSMAHFELGEYIEAEKFCRLSNGLPLSERPQTRNYGTWPIYVMRLGRTLQQMGNDSAAFLLFRQALMAWRAAYPDDEAQLDWLMRHIIRYLASAEAQKPLQRRRSDEVLMPDSFFELVMTCSGVSREIKQQQHQLISEGEDGSCDDGDLNDPLRRRANSI